MGFIVLKVHSLFQLILVAFSISIETVTTYFADRLKLKLGELTTTIRRLSKVKSSGCIAISVNLIKTFAGGMQVL